MKSVYPKKSIGPANNPNAIDSEFVQANERETDRAKQQQLEKRPIQKPKERFSHSERLLISRHFVRQQFVYAHAASISAADLFH